MVNPNVMSMGMLKVTQLNTSADGMIRVTLGDGGDGLVVLKTSKEYVPPIGSHWKVDFTPAAAVR